MVCAGVLASVGLSTGAETPSAKTCICGLILNSAFWVRGAVVLSGLTAAAVPGVIVVAIATAAVRIIVRKEGLA